MAQKTGCADFTFDPVTDADVQEDFCNVRTTQTVTYDDEAAAKAQMSLSTGSMQHLYTTAAWFDDSWTEGRIVNYSITGLAPIQKEENEAEAFMQ